MNTSSLRLLLSIVLALPCACEKSPAPATAPTKQPVEPEASLPASHGSAPTIARPQPAPKDTDPIAIDSASSPPTPSTATPSDESATTLPSFEPLHSAAVGDWCRYRLLDDQEERLTVVAADAASVTIEVRFFRHAHMIGLPAYRNEPRDLDPIRQWQTRKRTILRRDPAACPDTEDDADICVIHTWTEEGLACERHSQYRRTTPIYGLIASQTREDGQLVAQRELIGSGRRSGASE